MIRNTLRGEVSRRVALSAPLLLLSGRARAQGAAVPGSADGFPSRPVRVIVPYTPGGATDITARLLSERLSPRWGQPVVVENRPGANGIVGTEVVARGPADGTNLACVGVTHAVNAPLYRTPYDAVRDFTPVTVLYSVPLVLVAAPDFPAGTVAELASLAQRDPGGTTYAGTGGAVHLAGAMFAARSGTVMTHVPYRGSTAAHPDLMAGRVSVMFDTLPAVLGHVQSGKLKILAVTSAERLAVLPAVPTVAEQGYPGFEATSWGALLGPTGMPGTVTARIAADVAEALREPVVTERLGALGARVMATGPAEAGEFLVAEVRKWSEVAAGASIEKQ